MEATVNEDLIFPGHICLATVCKYTCSEFYGLTASLPTNFWDSFCHFFLLPTILVHSSSSNIWTAIHFTLQSQNWWLYVVLFLTSISLLAVALLRLCDSNFKQCFSLFSIDTGFRFLNDFQALGSFYIQAIEPACPWHQNKEILFHSCLLWK